MVEIEIRNGHKFTVEHGKWKPVNPADELDRLAAEVFELLCSMTPECDSDAEPDRDYCLARVVLRRFGGTITKSPPRPKPDKVEVIY